MLVLVAVAGAGTAGHASGIGPGLAVAELALGVLVGVAVGGAGGLAVKTPRGRGWVAGGFAGACVLALAGCAYACALALHGNGFIAVRQEPSATCLPRHALMRFEQTTSDPYTPRVEWPGETGPTPPTVRCLYRAGPASIIVALAEQIVDANLPRDGGRTLIGA